MRLDDLDYFLAVAAHGKVRAAAAALGVSQPAVTQGLQRLEKEMGFPLFTRSSSGMALTAAAEHFRQRTGLLRASLGEAIKEAAGMHLGQMGMVRVGVSPLYVQRLFVPAALELRRQRPAARLNVLLALNDALITALRVGDIELAISALPHRMPDDLQSLPLIEDDLKLVAREGHPLLNKRRLRLRDLVDVDWLLPGPQVAARRSLEGYFAQAGLPLPRVAVEVSNIGGGQLIAMVQHSDLVTLMSASQFGTAGAQGLAPLAVTGLRIARTIGVLTRKDAPLSPLAERLLELLTSKTAARPPRYSRNPSPGVKGACR